MAAQQNHFGCRSVALARKRCGRGAHAKAGRMPALPTVARRGGWRGGAGGHAWGNNPEGCQAPCREASGGSIGVNLRPRTTAAPAKRAESIVAHGEPSRGTGARPARHQAPEGRDNPVLRCRPVDALSPRFGATNTWTQREPVT